MSEWIKHTGTTNPVPNTVVEIYLNNGDMLVDNSEELKWAQHTGSRDGSIVFYRVIDVNNTNITNIKSNTTFNESVPKETLKLVLTNALKNRKSIDSLYADLIELL